MKCPETYQVKYQRIREEYQRYDAFLQTLTNFGQRTKLIAEMARLLDIMHTIDKMPFEDVKHPTNDRTVTVHSSINNPIIPLEAKGVLVGSIK